MGQCASAKAAAVGAHTRPMSRPLARHCSKVTEEVSKDTTKRQGAYSRGVATSFGFRKRPETADNVRRNTSSDVVDSNGNDESFESSTTSTVSRLGTRLPPPKKEASATRVGRFGFRQPNSVRTARTEAITSNNNAYVATDNNNDRARPKSVPHPKPAAARYTFHSSNLPRPQLPLRVADTKTAKTATNINRKISTGARSDGSSSKEGSVAGDSGIGSQSGHGEFHELDRSPRPPDDKSAPRPRHLQTLPGGRAGCFDVRDLEDAVAIPLPRLPSVFSTGLVRERTRDYQRQLDRRTRRECYGEEEKTFRDLSSNEKSSRLLFGMKCSSFARRNSDDVSSPGSDREFENDSEIDTAGEAMFDTLEAMLALTEATPPNANATVRRPSDDSSATSPSSSSSSTGAVPKTLRSVLLTIEDPFAAVAAKSSVQLLEDETSPQDSLISSFTESEDAASVSKRRQRAATPTKPLPPASDRSPLSPASPGTPTNASLSLSEGRDFLIDDEIADQPDLTFANADMRSSDATVTLGDPTPEPPAPLPPANYLNASVDTLSPCESIASDDLMLDFENSMSSGINDSTDRLDDNSVLHSLDETTLRCELQQRDEGIAREWSALLGQRAAPREPHPFASLGRAGELVRSRTNTPSSVPQSPRLLDRARASPGGAPPQRIPATTHGSPHRWRQDETAARDLLEIKSLVLKLQNVLHEREAIGCDPSDDRYENGCETDRDDRSLQMTDLRKQVLFLQSQLEDRDRTVAQLQGKVARFSLNTSLKTRLDNMCNAATQTDRVRTISAFSAFSAGPLQSSRCLPRDSSDGPLVSFRIGKVQFADLVLGLCLLCAVNLLCFLHLLYSCSACSRYTYDETV